MCERCSLFQAQFTNIKVTNLHRKLSRTIQGTGYNFLFKQSCANILNKVQNIEIRQPAGQ